MLTKPTPAVLLSIVNFRGHTGWGEVLKLFESELVALNRALAEAQEDCRLRQLQGRAQLLREFLALVENAPTQLERLGGSSL